jgi:Holliday junction resolvasome RuvABC endonuclease subunit
MGGGGRARTEAARSAEEGVTAAPLPVRRVVGVDPSLTATGLVVLELYGLLERAGGGAKVLARATLRTAADQSLYARAAYLHDALATLLADWRGRFDVREAVVEDPTDQVHVNRVRAGKKDQAAPSSIAKLGVGVGAVLCGLSVTQLEAVHLVTAGQWLPESAPGRKQKHGVTVDRIRRGVGLSLEATEHEVMAAGVAEWWLRGERVRELRRERGIPEPPALGRRPTRRRK